MKVHALHIFFCILMASLCCSCHSSRSRTRTAGNELYEKRITHHGNASKITKEPELRVPEKPIKTTETPKSVTEKAILDEAHSWLGVRYRYGACERSGTDCSGMVYSVFKNAAGITLPRDSRSQKDLCKEIKQSELRPADLVFFASRAGGSRIGHVGIYIGDRKFIHSSTSKGVIISSLDEDYYRRHFHSAGRLPQVNHADNAKSAKSPQQQLDELIDTLY